MLGQTLVLRAIVQKEGALPIKEMFVNRWILVLLTLVGGATAKVNYPFPYVAPYPYGTIPSQTTMKTRTLNAFKNWTSKYYEECSDGTARVKWVDPNKGDATGTMTVSEGIGYGMLIMVYLENDSLNNRARFDKLWSYYKKNRNGNGLMNWKIVGCSQGLGPNGQNGATDADLDVALALVMAYKQWGVDQYKTDAIELLGRIWSGEVNTGNYLLKAGDAGSLPYNPSYFSLGALRVFKQVDPSRDWGKVADACLALAKKSQHNTTGLVADWVNDQGQSQDVNGSGANKFGYDAVRTPWRILTDYLWFGTADAKSFLTKIDTWIKNKTGNDVGEIMAAYDTDGSTLVGTNTCDNCGSWSDPVNLGALLVPGMIVSEPTQFETSGDWLASGWNRLNTVGSANYYNQSWKLLYLLTLGGSFQNYWGSVKPNTAGVIGRDGRRISANWSIATTTSHVSVQVNGKGSVELIDASGRMRASAVGYKTLALPRPTEKGIYFAVIDSEGERAAIPVAIGN